MKDFKEKGFLSKDVNIYKNMRMLVLECDGEIFLTKNNLF